MGDCLRCTWPPLAQIFQTWPRRWRSRNLDLKSDRRRDVIASSIEWEIIYLFPRSISPTSHPSLPRSRTCVRCPRENGRTLSWDYDTRQRKLSHNYSLPRNRFILEKSLPYFNACHRHRELGLDVRLVCPQSSYHISVQTRKFLHPKGQEKNRYMEVHVMSKH